MAESAALLVDEVLPHEPMRQWVLSVPFPLRFLFASQPKVMGKALGIVYRTIATHLTRKAGYTKSTAHAGAVTLIQRFGGALNGLAWLYHENGKPGALVMARKASKLAPDNPAIQDTYGWILVQSGGAASGLAALQEAASKLPNNREVQYHLAYALAETRQADKAKVILKEILKDGKPFGDRDKAQALSGKLK